MTRPNTLRPNRDRMPPQPDGPASDESFSLDEFFAGRANRATAAQSEAMTDLLKRRAAAERGLTGQRDVVGVIFAFCAAIMVSAPLWGDVCGLTPDSVTYLDCARWLRDAGDYPPREVVHPPGLPLALAPLIGAEGTNWLAIRIFNSLCLAAAAAATVVLARAYLYRSTAWLAGLCVATSPLLFEQTIFLRSEPLFLALATTALALERRLAADVHKATLPRVALLGVLAAAAAMVRSIGVLLIPAIVLSMLWPSRRARWDKKRLLEYTAAAPTGRFADGRWHSRAIRILLFTVVATAPVVLWSAHRSPYAAKEDYLHQLRHPRPNEMAGEDDLRTLWAGRVLTYLPVRTRQLTECIIPPRLGWRLLTWPLGWPVAWIVAGLVLAGAAIMGMRHRSAAHMLLLMSIGLLALWPWEEDARLFAPLEPVIWITLLIGAEVAARRIRAAWRKPVVALAAMALIGAQSFEGVLAAWSLRGREPHFADVISTARHLVAWHDTHLGPCDTWVARTVQGDSQKVALMLCGYLVSRPVGISDLDASVPPPDPDDPQAVSSEEPAATDAPASQPDDDPVEAGRRYVCVTESVPAEFRRDLQPTPLIVIDGIAIYALADPPPALLDTAPAPR